MELTRPAISSDALFDQVIALVRQRLNKSTPNRDWTKTLKLMFGEVAKDTDANYVVSSSAHSGEVLFDLAWWRNNSYTDMLLCMESEWENEEEVANDFIKLMIAKASLKIMIFSTKNDELARGKIKVAIEKYLLLSLHHIKDEEYLLFNFPYGLPGMAYLSRYTVPVDGKQDVVNFVENPGVKLWD